MSTPANELRLDDGFSTIITLENLPTVKLFETEVTPPGYAAGGAIPTTTMRNIAYRTQAPRKLKNLTKMTFTAAYATSAVPLIWTEIGKNQRITVTFPDGSTLMFWGWVEDFTPAAHKEGTQPTATVTVEPGMRDADGEEVAPEYEASGDSSSS
jgi:hypothetical protein